MYIEFFRNAAENVVKRYQETLFCDFDANKQIYPVTLGHFCPVNTWKAGRVYLIDETTGDSYCNDDFDTKRLKNLAILGFTPLVHAIGLVLNCANRIAKLVTLAHFWYPSNAHYSFTARLGECSRDILRVALSPIIYVGLLLAAAYGLVRPYDGGKLYATLERATYTTDIIAPCFQPEPRSHLGGGKLDQRNAW